MTCFFTSLRLWNGDEGKTESENPWYFAELYTGLVFRYGTDQKAGSYETWNSEFFYNRRQKVSEEFAEMLSLTEDEIRYWKEKEDSITKPFVYQSTNDIRRLKEIYQFTLTLTCILIGIFLSDSFAGESMRQTDELIRSSRYGQKHTLSAKLTAGIVFSFTAGCLMLVSAQLPVILFSGLHGFDAPWYLVEPFSSISMKAGRMIHLHLLVFFLACVLIGLITIFLSLWFNKTAAAMGSVFAIVVLDLFINVPAKLRVLSQMRYLTPLSVLTNTHVQDMRLTKLFGKYWVSFQTGPALYVLCGMILISLIILLFHQVWENR